MSPLFGIFEGALSPMHLLVVLIIGILLFGKRLPEMGRMLGKGLMEFKKGFSGLEDEVSSATNLRSADKALPEPIRAPQRVGVQAPKFEVAPPPGTPSQNVTAPQPGPTPPPQV
jgi:sec-independent protein translocase protein TatA